MFSYFYHIKSIFFSSLLCITVTPVSIILKTLVSYFLAANVGYKVVNLILHSKYIKIKSFLTSDSIVNHMMFTFSTVEHTVFFSSLRKEWLQKTGSPSSRIDKAEFKNEKEIEDYSFKSFSIRH